MMSLLAAASYADTSGMQSGTPGAYGAKPLHFVSITLVGGGGNALNSATVPLNPKFELLFDKNIVDDLVWAKNSQCFQLYDQAGQEVPVVVTRDSIDFSQRQVVYVQPASPLSPGAAYQLKVSPSLLAKNGVSVLSGTTNGQGVTISFTTAAAQTATTASQATPPTAQAALPTAAQATTPAPAASPGTAKTATQATAPAAAGKQQQQASGTPFTVTGPRAESPQGAPVPGWRLSALDWYTILIVVLIAGWVALEAFLTRKKKKTDSN
jgi:hypothetical protein